MNQEQTEREAFEAWIKSPPFEHDCKINPDDGRSAWPGAYRRYETELAWEAFKAGRFPANPTSELLEETPVKRRRESLGCWLVYPILRLAAKVMDEPEGAGKPPMPWRELSLCALIAMVSVLAVWALLDLAL